MKNSNNVNTYVPLDQLVREIEEYKYHHKEDNSQENFEKSVNMVRNTLSALFGFNDERLIDTLSYDAYKLFFDSKAEIEVLDSCDGRLDAQVKETEDSKISGSLTKNHNDGEGIYYGHLEVSYLDESGKKVSRDYLFVSDELFGNHLIIRTEFEDAYYYENIYINKENVIYDVVGTFVGFRCTNETIDSIINESSDKTLAEKSKVLFPEVYRKEYFKDYDFFQRDRK